MDRTQQMRDLAARYAAVAAKTQNAEVARRLFRVAERLTRCADEISR